MKLPSAFFLPFVGLLFLEGRVKWRWLALFPAVYALAIAPAWIAGRPLFALMQVYPGQAASNWELTMNAPSVWQWFPTQRDALMFTPVAIYATFAAVLVAVFWLRSNAVTTQGPRAVTIALFFLVLVPFLLPKMHERYWYGADLLAVIFAFTNPKRWYVAALVGGASFFSYQQFLLGSMALPWWALTAAMAVTLVILEAELAPRASAAS